MKQFLEIKDTKGPDSIVRVSFDLHAELGNQRKVNANLFSFGGKTTFWLRGKVFISLL